MIDITNQKWRIHSDEGRVDEIEFKNNGTFVCSYIQGDILSERIKGEKFADDNKWEVLYDRGKYAILLSFNDAAALIKGTILDDGNYFVGNHITQSMLYDNCLVIGVKLTK